MPNSLKYFIMFNYIFTLVRINIVYIVLSYIIIKYININLEYLIVIGRFNTLLLIILNFHIAYY